MKTIYKIRKIRGQKGFSQEYMASQLGVSQRTYGRLEAGKSKISIENLRKISEVLDVDPYKLIGFEYQETFINHENEVGKIQNINHAINTNLHTLLKEIKTLYEKLIDEKNARIRMLEEKIRENNK